MSDTKCYIGYFEVLDILDDGFKNRFFFNNNIVQVENASYVPCEIHKLSVSKELQSVRVKNQPQPNDYLTSSTSKKICSCDVGCSCIVPIELLKVIRIGRDSDCDLVIDHPATSLLHFVLWTVQFDPNTAPITYLMDKSRNGVFINGTLLGKGNLHILQDYDIIVIKRAIKISFRLLDDGERILKFPYKREVGNWVVKDLLLGCGAYGDVFIARKRDNSKNFAVKIIKNVKDQKLKLPEGQLKNESKILMKLNHVHDAIMVEGNLYIFEDLVSGGDLFSYMFRGSLLRTIPESESIVIIFQLLKAINYLHNELHIIHRDLKLDNVLLSLPIPGSRIYLCDFGIAKVLGSTYQRAKSIVGTVEYSAPEVFKEMAIDDTKPKVTALERQRGYNYKCDMWSLGVMLYIMITGISPFFGSDPDAIIQNAREGKLDLEEPYFSKFSNQGKDFMRCLLHVDPDIRMSVNDCFKHRWISNNREFLEKVYKKLQST